MAATAASDELVIQGPQRPDITPQDVAKAMEGAVRAADTMARLAKDAPQVLLLEGGSRDLREKAALHWAALVNCQGAAKPCHACAPCRQFVEMVHRDLYFLDGAAGSIKIGQVRAVRGVLGEPPRGDGMRVIILAEAQNLTLEAANALLKSLEEPRPGASFVLIAPQRERLLPTLVSRSWVLTLPWPRQGAEAPARLIGAEEHDWPKLVAAFAATGKGLFQATGAKGAVTREAALMAVNALQGRLAEAMAADGEGGAKNFAARMDPAARRQADVALAKAQQALNEQVNPALVLDWLGVTLHRLAHDRPQPHRRPQADR